MSTPRIKRPTLERNGPSRAWARAFDQGQNGARRSEPAESAARRAGSTTAFEAVNDAYRVIDEYLWQGQDLAQRLCRPGAEAPPPAEAPPLERLMRSTGELARAWLEVLQSWSGPAAGASPPPPASPGPFGAGGSASAAERGASRRAAMAVVVQTERRVHVQVELDGEAAPEDLVLGELVADGPERLVLEGVVLERAEPGGRMTVRLSLAREQPSGLYLGRLLDRESGAVRGTISVSVPRAAG